MTIRELRLQKGMTRAAFAKSLGIGLSTLDGYEAGRRDPSAKALAAIMNVYGLDLTDPALDEAAMLAEAEEAALAAVAEADEEAAEKEADDEATVEETAEEEAAEEVAAEEAAEEEAEEEAADEEAEEAAEEADDEAAAEEEAAEEEVAEEEADDEAAAEEEAAEEADDEAAEEEVAEEADEAADEEAEEAADGASAEAAVEAAFAEAIEEAQAEEAAAEEAELIAAAEKAARKAEKKARKAEKLAARQRADEEAAQRVIDIISIISGSVGLDERDAVLAARDAYDSLTDDQELMIPGDVLRALFMAEGMIEAAEEAAAKQAETSVPIAECRITVKDVPYTGKKIKKPAVKVVCGEVALKPGEDYSFKYDKKTRDIGLYMLTIKGKGRFTGSVKVPFYVVPKAASYARLLAGDKQAARTWKLLKNIEGYQIEYSQDKDFSHSKKAKICKPKDLPKALKKLKAGKKYYLRVRIFATVKKKHHYSEWSKVKTVKL